jgi:hypothetical protein
MAKSLTDLTKIGLGGTIQPGGYVPVASQQIVEAYLRRSLAYLAPLTRPADPEWFLASSFPWVAQMAAANNDEKISAQTHSHSIVGPNLS